jgi:hypothetical protein
VLLLEVHLVSRLEIVEIQGLPVVEPFLLARPEDAVVRTSGALTNLLTDFPADFSNGLVTAELRYKEGYDWETVRKGNG